MTSDQVDKIYIKSFQYPDDPDRGMYPDTSTQFIIEFATLEDRNKSTAVLNRIDQILSTFKFTDNKDDSMTVKLYFHNQRLDPNFINIVANDYHEVSVPKTSTPLKDSINELLKLFIAEDEKTYGSRVLNFKLKSATIVDGVAKLVFDDPEFYTSGGSTRVNLIYSQIEKTALQFPTVKKVDITGAVFQP